MIQELINFTANLDDAFKNLGSLPKEGLHILINLKSDNGHVSIDTDQLQYEQFSKKEKGQLSDFLEDCKRRHQNAWYIDTNKCIDPAKAIHTCSPFAVAFKREHLEGGAKFNRNAGVKPQIHDRFSTYFGKALKLIGADEEVEKYHVFKLFFSDNQFSQVVNRIQEQQAFRYSELGAKLSKKKEVLKTTDSITKEQLKKEIAGLEQQMLKLKPLEDSDYIIFYLNVPLASYQQIHKRYLDDKLFNTAAYNTAPDEQGLIYGTSNFMNGFNSDMPFLMHQTASFDITGRISNVDAKILHDFINILPNKSLPLPLPIFIYKGELLQDKVISIFKESGFKFGYKEIIQKLAESHKEDIANYYLLFWQNSKDGIVFKDFDFVSKFEFSVNPTVIIQNFFDLWDKEKKENKHYPIIDNVFDFEQQVLKPLLQSKYHKLDYFGDLNKEDYTGMDFTFISYCKYRKNVYDFVYKSQRNTINATSFNEMIFNSIRDDIKKNNDWAVKEKLNIWYSISDFFSTKKEIKMANKLKEYQDFVAAVIQEEQLTDITDEKFAFAAGQVIDYIHNKSKSADMGFNLLEPYLQQSRCAELKKAISNDFGRYKHENFSRNFQQVAAFVLSYETDTNIKHLMPQLLSGVFAKNQLYSQKNSDNLK